MTDYSNVNDTWNRTKAPFKDDNLRNIIFAHTKYHVPQSEGSAYLSLYNALATAVANEDGRALNTALANLEPYRIGTATSSAYRQTELVDIKTGKVVG
jgi:hypothetical protein